MCAGDMTPIPTKYYEALGRNYVASDVRHTCRNFERLRNWVVERYEGETAVRPGVRECGVWVVLFGEESWLRRMRLCAICILGFMLATVGLGFSDFSCRTIA